MVRMTRPAAIAIRFAHWEMFIGSPFLLWASPAQSRRSGKRLSIHRHKQNAKLSLCADSKADLDEIRRQHLRAMPYVGEPELKRLVSGVEIGPVLADLAAGIAQACGARGDCL